MLIVILTLEFKVCFAPITFITKYTCEVNKFLHTGVWINFPDITKSLKVQTPKQLCSTVEVVDNEPYDKIDNACMGISIDDNGHFA